MGHDSTKGSKKRPSAADEYGPDGDAPPPKTKKMKQPAATTKPTKSKAAATPSARKTDVSDGEYFELSPTRRLTIESFKGLTLVNIREYYNNKNDNGKMLPGKKGISLPVAQFQALVALLPEIEVALEARGEVLGRPEYGAAGVGVGVGDGGGGGGEEGEEGGGDEGDEGEGDEEEEEGEEEEGKRGPRKGKGKENFEATSEEEEEEEG
ncbi:MAG: hypothetical protein LQ344_003756 [Seirophora lacunosa]|nr:MAG: hypothetical protein LQ344_003756 [Seirophora lacunosa]